MEKRYQVFISSTFNDLVVERREVMQALLEIDCIPSGMELFPAANTDQWTLIKSIIEQCDYYVVIIGGRYGTMTEEGISYTEKEYDLALELGIPVIGFVPAEPDSTPIGRTDKNPEAAAKLENFLEKVQSKMTARWSNADDLGAKVTRGMMHLMKKEPRAGWVRGDQAMTAETRTEIAELQAKIAKFEKDEAVASAVDANQMNKQFAHGRESIALGLAHQYADEYGDVSEEMGTLDLTWDQIFKRIGPMMFHDATQASMRKAINDELADRLIRDEDGEWTQGRDEIALIDDHSWNLIITQLRALGLIVASVAKRGAADKNVYWKLTPAGDEYLLSLLAIPAGNAKGI